MNNKKNKLNVIIINRKDRPKRLISTLNELSKLNFNINIIYKNACLPNVAKQLRYHFLDTKAYDNILNSKNNSVVIPSWGALGCSISHYESWEYLIDNNLKYAMIIEDDISFDILFINYLNKLLKKFKKKKTPNCYLFGSKKKKILLNNKKYYPIYDSFHCYLINNIAANLLLNHTVRFNFQLNIHISLLSIFNSNLRLKLFKKYRVTQKKFYSDTQIINYNNNTMNEILPRKLPNELIKHIISFLPYYNYYSYTF